jgi:CheY-like chemotaxis protein/signal transduction histidine kinase
LTQAEPSANDAAPQRESGASIARTRGKRKRRSEGERQTSESRHSVLIVEDNPTTRRVVRLTLEQHGFHVLEAPDGRTALHIMELERPRLVLQDLLLPDIDGLDLVGELRNRAGNAKVSILAFSGFMAKPDALRIREAGFDDMITKPIDSARLVSILESHLLLTAPTPDRFGAGRRVIVADPNPMQLRITRLRLERLGFRVRSATNGLQALELARRIKPDVLIADAVMPRLDGFGLSMAARQDAELRALTIVLVTCGSVEDADRGHARRSGANRLVQRTPDLKELIQALRGTTIAPEATPLVMPEAMLGLEQERSQRLLAQLERETALNQELARRCSALAAELTVFSQVSEAVVRSGDLGAALDQALAICLDAGGVSVGVLYLLDRSSGLRVRTLGALPGWDADQLQTFFGHESLLRWIMQGEKVVAIPSRELPTDLSIDLLQRSGAANVLVVPLVWRATPLGALVMIARDRELDQENWHSFVQGMGNHITQALALIEAFESKEHAEREARDQTHLFRAVLDNIDEGVVAADRDGRFLLWNAAAETITGSDANGATSSTEWAKAYGLYRPDQVSPMPNDELPLVRALRGETTEVVGMFIQPTGADRGRFIQAKARPLLDEAGAQNGGVVVFRDMTEAERGEALRLTSEHSTSEHSTSERSTSEHSTSEHSTSEHSTSEHSTFECSTPERSPSEGAAAASIAQEINHPLSAVLTNLELALAELDEVGRHHPLPNALWEELRDVRGGTERIRRIARDLGVFSRSTEDDAGPVDIRRVLDSTLRLTWKQVRHRARLVKRYETVPPVNASESRLGQVFFNLIVSAAQAIPEGHSDSHEIRVSTGLDPRGKVLVTVADTGTLTFPISRKQPCMASALRPAELGAGLGFSMCERIITSLGGEIALDRREGQGTVVRVALPPAPQ